MTDDIGKPDLRQRARHALERSQRQDSAGEQAPDPQTLALLEATLKAMPVRTREIFLAARMDAMSYREIAKATGLSITMVERHMAKAIGLLDHALRYGSVPAPRRRWRRLWLW
ncbi:RNA polymerase sigma factor [Sphingobium phenoxybenzoativorans]|uniref:RNA polymerase sigma factor n=1 Tax=Sphingobium phenoxybenzoativorans TaxID=1592790 RepID=UPI0009F2865B|nr:sigma factor-like helix-turn-helix DNA-binding protein [Sphingobium phenoxybenzoativorans]